MSARRLPQGSGYRKLIGGVLLASATLFAGGCIPQKETADLKQYIQEVKAKKANPIEPLPEIKTFENFVYEADELREPFTAAIRELAEQALPTASGLFPDISRRREPLESFSLKGLSMVAMLTLQERTWAAVRAPDGTVHRLQVGNYIGRDHGQVVSISETSIGLTEIVTDGRGGWKERENALSMNLQQ